MGAGLLGFQVATNLSSIKHKTSNLLGYTNRIFKFNICHLPVHITTVEK